MSVRSLVFLLLLAILPHLTNSGTVTPIQHVIIVVDENHSFDNIFGIYPFGYPPVRDNVTLSVMRPENYLSQGFPSIPWIPGVPIYTGPYLLNSSTPPDPQEGYTAYHLDYWYGTTQGFPLFSGSQSLGYFSYEQVGVLWDYAEEYVLFDNFYSPVLDVTEPNRIADLVGLPPTFHNDEASGIYAFNQTIMYQLSLHNVSWDYFVYDLEGTPWPISTLRGVSGFENHFQNLSNFFMDLRNGSLPSVSWVMFLGGGSDKYDMHPPNNVTLGAEEFANVVNAVMESSVWNSTVIFFTFDEGGGYYDQIVPPAINGTSFGQRIPLLLISPYAKEGFVDNYTTSGYTLLGFVDYNWRLPWLTQWVEQSDVNGLLMGFNFSHPRPPLVLTAKNWSCPVPLQYSIHYGYVAIISHPIDPGLYSLQLNDVRLMILSLIMILALLLLRRRKGFRRR
ncbi:alkaline phosphatase family protein [Metallosphaera hakonensis]|uniref:Acid phosphatase n=1 Tax=Metallosphaera hakonensis JCM 8857 = DSM 7519 TaxID=1293036 RepID=A0A2U9IRK4_9CREN|nr:alkaline phosphatase family protein [Metallosphaera hakonensis]AWR98607.1 acid phosphatase [Metallosphaera hakonensis JCM 8857 = DSM 7519]